MVERMCTELISVLIFYQRSLLPPCLPISTTLPTYLIYIHRRRPATPPPPNTLGNSLLSKRLGRAFRSQNVDTTRLMVVLKHLGEGQFSRKRCKVNHARNLLQTIRKDRQHPRDHLSQWAEETRPGCRVTMDTTCSAHKPRAGVYAQRTCPHGTLDSGSSMEPGISYGRQRGVCLAVGFSVRLFRVLRSSSVMRVVGL